MKNLVQLMDAAIRRCDLDLSGIEVLTEAATGAYVVTPVLAAMAGARRVFALTRSSRHGTVEEVEHATRDLARRAAVSDRISVFSAKWPDMIGRADIVTNSGHVRPIDTAMVGRLKPTAVIPLMYEAWEFRAADVDLAECSQRRIPVAGTNERHPAVDLFPFVGAMAIRLLSDASVSIPGSRVLVWCDNPFRPVLVSSLEQAGARVADGESLEDGVERTDIDAILVAMRPRVDPIVGDREAEAIARRHPGAVVLQFWGDLDRAALARRGVSFRPIEPPPLGHQGILPSCIGAEPVVRLQAGGLKVGEVMARARMSGTADPEDAVAVAVASGFGQAVE